MSAPATVPATVPAALPPPDEQAVADWMRIRLADMHARHGVKALSIHAVWVSHSGEIDFQWCLHDDGGCVVGQRTIAEGVKALREQLEARS
jgi:hypothetical protein